MLEFRSNTGGQLEESAARPVRQDADEVAQAGLGVEPMKTGRGDEAEEVARRLSVVVAADKEPRLAAMPSSA